MSYFGLQVNILRKWPFLQRDVCHATLSSWNKIFWADCISFIQLQNQGNYCWKILRDLMTCFLLSCFEHCVGRYYLASHMKTNSWIMVLAFSRMSREIIFVTVCWGSKISVFLFVFTQFLTQHCNYNIDYKIKCDRRPKLWISETIMIS